MPTQNFIPKIDSRRALALYDDGASDLEIAAVFGVSANGICRWRMRHGLCRVAHNDNRVSAAQVRQAKTMLRNGATRAQIAAHLGVSSWTIQQLRRGMDGEGLRPSGINGEAIRLAVINDQHLPRRIEKAIGLNVPRDIRIEAVNDMYLELLDGKLRADQIESAAPRFRSKAYQMTCNNYSPRSLDEENEDGFSLADVIADPNWEAPFDEVLGSVFANDD